MFTNDTNLEVRGGVREETNASISLERVGVKCRQEGTCVKSLLQALSSHFLG